MPYLYCIGAEQICVIISHFYYVVPSSAVISGYDSCRFWHSAET